LKPLITLKHVQKKYNTPAGKIEALKDICIQVEPGEFLGVIGKSGAGKSTMINMITGVDNLTDGEIWINDVAVHQLNQNQMALWRGKNIGVIYQSFELLPQISILDNVILPIDFCGSFQKRQAKQKAMELLEKMQIAEHAFKKPTMISGGQQQRVVIARALINNPPIIVADEPTGSLDSKTGETVIKLFEELITGGKTILMVTHDKSYQSRFTRVMQIADGIITQENR
jgi:putative ABC transport system ATP-binding protein